MEKEKKDFIIKRGVLGWGITTAILFSLLMSFVKQDATFLGTLATAIILFPIGGYFWGLWMWHMKKKK